MCKAYENVQIGSFCSHGRPNLARTVTVNFSPNDLRLQWCPARRGRGGWTVIVSSFVSAVDVCAHFSRVFFLERARAWAKRKCGRAGKLQTFAMSFRQAGQGWNAGRPGQGGEGRGARARGAGRGVTPQKMEPPTPRRTRSAIKRRKRPGAHFLAITCTYCDNFGTACNSTRALIWVVQYGPRPGSRLCPAWQPEWVRPGIGEAVLWVGARARECLRACARARAQVRMRAYACVRVRVRVRACECACVRARARA